MKVVAMRNGFTLIELVIVIVILGILAVVAAPRFLNLSTDARVAAVEGLKAASHDALTLTYSKAVIEGVESEPGNISVETNLGILELKYGYPEAFPEIGIGFLDILQVDEEEWDICFGSSDTSCSTSNSSNVRVGIGIKEDPTRLCYIRYIEPTGTNNPSEGTDQETYHLAIETEGC